MDTNKETRDTHNTLSLNLTRILYVFTTGGLAPYLKYLPVILLSPVAPSTPLESTLTTFTPSSAGLILFTLNILSFLSGTTGNTCYLETAAVQSTKGFEGTGAGGGDNEDEGEGLGIRNTNTNGQPKPGTSSSSSYGSLRLYGALGWGGMSYLSSLYVTEETDASVTSLGVGVFGSFIVAEVSVILAAAFECTCLKGSPVSSPTPLASSSSPLSSSSDGALNQPQEDWQQRGLRNVADEEEGGEEEDTKDMEAPLLPPSSGACNSGEVVSPPFSIRHMDKEKRTDFILLLLNMLFTGFFVAFVESYLFSYLTYDYGCTASFLGLCIVVMVAFEVPVFLKSHDLIKKLGGTSNCYLLSHALYVTRVLCYTVVPKLQPWVFLLLEPSHALVFALMMICGVEDGRLYAEGGRDTAVAQGLVRNTYYALGLGMGSWAGGAMVGWGGYRFMYRGGAAGMTVWAGIRWGIERFRRKRRGRGTGD
ncbi:hypothetical protein TrCOL_g13582 [Triparma columacea]|uniref:Major facilitator superfamily associated domain-containing protein n=1 Tax=Triparma columacea TaxID=722753 RepID=A0A9W7GJI1_9STRA|nr:hypothetical protein TrCOL_g13582 [Triparma columacea]